MHEESSAVPNPSEVKELFCQILDSECDIEQTQNTPPDVNLSADEILQDVDESTREAVLSLLEAHKRAQRTGLFYHPESDGTHINNSNSPSNQGVSPPIIEGYTLGNEIGRGGFGVVYRGEQLSPINRPVAIKILRTDLVTPTMISRFMSEASFLARMNHEAIAKVIDAGFDHDHRPFVAMELIDGSTIVEFCKTHSLTLNDRILLFKQVCNAVHHAHQRAVIHRDLKPANILVEYRDHKACPKIIDFGIAKLLEDNDAHPNTLISQRIGTPRYMSPEQVDGQQEVDIRIDIYALGVLLCEVLTGELPYKDTGSGLRVSMRPSSIAECTNTKELKGDLDRIILKASAADPDMRYQSAAAMSDDLQRYMSGLPVLATHPGFRYRTKKFFLRHKLVSTLAGIASVGILVGAIGLSIGIERATASRDIAKNALKESERQHHRAEFVNRFILEDMLEAIDPNVNQGREISVREVFDRATSQLNDRDDIDIETQFTTLRLIGLVYSEIGEHDEAMGAFRRAAELAEEFHGGSCKESIEIRLHLYDVIVSNGRSGMTKLGQQLNEDALETLSLDDELYRRVRMRTTDSVDELNEIIESIKADPNGDKKEHLRGVTSLATLYAFAYERDKEIECRRISYELSREIYGDHHSATFGRLGHYAALRITQYPDLETLDMLKNAYEPSREMLGLEHPLTLRNMRSYANLLGRIGDVDEAVALLEECESGHRARFGASSTSHTVTCSILGEHYLLAGRAQEALNLQLQVRKDRARQWSKGHRYHLVDQLNIAECFYALDQFDNARTESMRAIELTPPDSMRALRASFLHAKSVIHLELDQESAESIDRTLDLFGVLSVSSAGYDELSLSFASFLEEHGYYDEADRLRNTQKSAQNKP